VFAPVTRHAWSQGRDSCDCNKSGGTKAYVSNIPQTSNRPSKKQEIKPEIICGPSPAGHGGRAEARSARVGSGFIPAAAHVEPSRERPEEESLSIQLDCTTLTQKNLKASDRTNPSGPYYKDTSQSEPTKQQKKTKKRAPWVRRRFCYRQWAGRPEYFRAERTIGSLSPNICIYTYINMSKQILPVFQLLPAPALPIPAVPQKSPIHGRGLQQRIQPNNCPMYPINNALHHRIL
jgi:hypothetical protein